MEKIFKTNIRKICKVTIITIIVMAFILPAPAMVADIIDEREVPASEKENGGKASTYVEGIDVSHHQGNLTESNWETIYNAGKRFAFVKATQGINAHDEMFNQNMEHGCAAGLEMGAYHFATPYHDSGVWVGNDAVDEARDFITVCRETEDYLSYPYLRPALDLEINNTWNHTQVSKEQLSQWVHDWMNYVSEKTTVEPILYVGPSFAREELESSVGNYSLWLCHYAASPDVPNYWDDWDFWQTGTGSIPDLTGDFDFDKFNGVDTWLRNFIIGENDDPPYIPCFLWPGDGDEGVGIDTDLSWYGDDPDGDSLVYDVYFGTNNPLIDPLPNVVRGQTECSYNPGSLDDGTTYYWKIVARDQLHGRAQHSPFWVFTTEDPCPWNNPPYEPSNPNPPYSGKDGVDPMANLSWSGGDPDSGDTVTYDIYLGTTDSPPLIKTNHGDPPYSPAMLSYNTLYYWKIIARDNHGATTAGPVWSFMTIPYPSSGFPPFANAGGLYTGKANEAVTFDCSWSTDMDDGFCCIEEYRWDWTNNGWDAEDSGWLSFDYPETTHTYTEEFQGYAKLEVRDNEGATDDALASVDILPADPVLWPYIDGISNREMCPPGTPFEYIVLDGGLYQGAGAIPPFYFMWEYRKEGQDSWTTIDDWTQSATLFEWYPTCDDFGLLDIKFSAKDSKTPIPNVAYDIWPNCVTLACGDLWIYFQETSYGVLNQQPVPLEVEIFYGLAPFDYRCDFENDGIWDTDWTRTWGPNAPYGSCEVDHDHVYPQIGEYAARIQVRDLTNTILSDTKTVIIYPPVMAVAGGLSSAQLGRPVSFSGSAAGGSQVYTSWEWDFGDGSPHSYEQNPSHIYNEENEYTVTLTVTDNKGFTDSDTITINICPVINENTGEGFSDIQSAIDASNTLDGHTISVSHGTYNGNIAIDKSIILEGENRDTTYIVGYENVLEMAAQGASITGFTIQNSGPGYDPYTNIPYYAISLSSSYNTISENSLTDNNGGIHLLPGSSHNTIIGNTITGTTMGGGVLAPALTLESSTGNTIRDNTIKGSFIYDYDGYHFGTGVSIGSSSDNIISGNTISRVGSGIGLGGSNRNSISDNTITTQSGYMGYEYGISLWYSSDNSVDGNHIHMFFGFGIWLDGSSNNNRICWNDFQADYGIEGIVLYGSSDNMISYNMLSNGCDYGIMLRDGSSNNIISGNTISNNNGRGISIESNSNSNYIYHNNFIDNYQNAYDCGANTWYSPDLQEGNYWDDYEGSGPYIIPPDPPGNQDIYPLRNPWVPEGHALRFDGEDDYVDCGNDASLDITDEITIEAWICPTGWGENNFGRIVHVNRAEGDKYLFFLANNEGQKSIGFYAAGVTTDDFIGPANSITLNTWQHVAVTYDRNQIKLYVNGEKIASQVQTAAMMGGIDRAYIGNRPQLDRTFDGLIDQVKIFKGTAMNENDRVLELHFDEGCGTVARDISCYGNHGTINGATWVFIGSALSFDGDDDYVEIENDASLQVSGDLTISFWIKPENLGTGRINPIDKSYGGEFALTIEPNGGLTYYHGTQRTSGYYWGWWALDAESLVNGKWQHITITRDASTRTMKSYLNGELQNTATYPDDSNKLPSPSSYPVLIGKGYTGVYFDGLIDEVKIFNSAATNENNKILELNFDESHGNIAHDISEYGNHGTIHGAVWVPGLQAPELHHIGTQFIPFGYKRPLPNIHIIASDPNNVNLKFYCWGLPSWLHFTDYGDGTALIHGTMMLFGPAIYRVTVSVTNGYKYDSEEFILWFYDPDNPPQPVELEDAIL